MSVSAPPALVPKASWASGRVNIFGILLVAALRVGAAEAAPPLDHAKVEAFVDGAVMRRCARDGGGENPGRSILLISCRSRFSVLERRLFVSGHAFFSHRQDHGDADIGSGHRRQIDDLLFAEKLLGAIEQLV